MKLTVAELILRWSRPLLSTRNDEYNTKSIDDTAGEMDEWDNCWDDSAIDLSKKSSCSPLSLPGQLACAHRSRVSNHVHKCARSTRSLAARSRITRVIPCGDMTLSKLEKTHPAYRLQASTRGRKGAVKIMRPTPSHGTKWAKGSKHVNTVMNHYSLTTSLR